MIRPHPIFKIFTNDILKKINFSIDNLYIDWDVEQDLYTILSKSKVHLTSYSSICYEALVFKVPTIIWSTEGREIYKGEIENNVFEYASNTKSMISIIDKKIKKNTPSKDIYFESFKKSKLLELLKS